MMGMPGDERQFLAAHRPVKHGNIVTVAETPVRRRCRGPGIGQALNGPPAIAHHQAAQKLETVAKQGALVPMNEQDLTHGSTCVVDDETQAKIDVVKQRLIKFFGYNETSATDVLNYVASIFARGDTKRED